MNRLRQFKVEKGLWMRQIGTIADEQDASRFGAFLLTLGIDNSVEELGDQWAVWVENDDHLDRARAELEKFHASPVGAHYDEAIETAKVVQAEKERAEQRRRNNFIDVRTRMGQPRQWNAPLTLALIVISIVVGVLTHVWEDRRGADEPGAVNALRIAPVTIDGDYIRWDDLNAVRHGEVWRLVTPIFLHFGLLHILFNLVMLFSLGTAIETRRGTLFFASLVLVTAIASNLAEYYWGHHPNFGGMSGVDYALFGYLWIKGRIDPSFGVSLPQQTVVIMLAWLVACMVGVIPHVANAAHVVGLVAGVAFACVPYLFRRVRR